MPAKGVKFSCLCGNQDIVKRNAEKQYSGTISHEYVASQPCICWVGKRMVQATSVVLNTVNAR